MKKFAACILTAVSLICVALTTYFLLANAALSAGLQMAILPIVASLVTAFFAGKLFGAEETSAVQNRPAANQA